MSLLLATDEVTLYPPSPDLDEHGWRLPDEDASYWTGPANLQLGPGISDPRAGDKGGRGPYGPARDDFGQLYLPEEVDLLEGSTAILRGRTFVLSQTRKVLDPTGYTAACWVATATSVDTWPDGGEVR